MTPVKKYMKYTNDFNLLELFVIFEVFNFTKPENESELWLWKMIWTEA